MRRPLAAAHARKVGFHLRLRRVGAIESQVNDQPKRVYHAGESWYETPGSSHRVSRNASATAPAKLLAVFVVDTDDKTLTTPVRLSTHWGDGDAEMYSSDAGTGAVRF